MQTRITKSIVLVVSLSAGILVGLFLSVSVFSNVSARAATTAPSTTTSVAYPQNAQGETYGISPQTAHSEDQEPDLIAAVGVDGVKGYVKKADLDKDMAKSPEEAVAIMKQRESLKTTNTYEEIPLYASDGKTVVGKFRLSRGNVTTIK